jgi:hypothetical protein
MNALTQRAVVSAQEIDEVSGGWCGTPYPGSWRFPIPEPDPYPWYREIATSPAVIPAVTAPAALETVGLATIG